MKKLIFFLFFVTLSTNATADYKSITSPDDLTMSVFQELARTTGYTDHIPHFKKIFENYPVRDFLEFGLGFSTKYFLDNCEKVVSVEFVTPGSGPEWIKECLKLYETYSNWHPITYFSGHVTSTDWSKYSFFGSEEVYKAASYQCSEHKNYAFLNDYYMTELNEFILEVVRNNNIDVAFVDSGIYNRGDLVQLLFNKVPIILAHDARCRARGQQDDVYAYCRVFPPKTYEELYIDAGMGIMVWIKKEEKYNALRNAIKEYIQQGDWSFPVEEN